MKRKKMLISIIVVVAVLASLTVFAFAAEIPELEAWKAERMQILQDRLDQAVTDGRLTTEEADSFYADRVERMEACDGTGLANGESRQGIGSGYCGGLGDGAGLGYGAGRGARRGGMGGFGGCGGACFDADDVTP